jgi:hypothetical protein
MRLKALLRRARPDREPARVVIGELEVDGLAR